MTQTIETRPQYTDIRDADRMRIMGLLSDCGAEETHYADGCLCFGLPADRDISDALLLILPKILLMTDNKTPYRLKHVRTYRESSGPRETRREIDSCWKWKHVVFEIV